MPFFKNCKKVLATWPNFFWLVIVLFMVWRAFFWEGLAHKALYDFDEARYAEVAKNINKTHNWLIPLSGGPDEPRDLPIATLANGQVLYPYFWKPPLHTWVIAGFYRLFGTGELAVRLPSFLAGLGTLLLTYLLAKAYWPKQKLLPYLAVLLLVSLNDFGFVTTYGNSDSLLLFLSLLSLFFATGKKAWQLALSGVFWGLAFLTKSVATFWLPLVILLQFGFFQEKLWLRKMWLIGLGFLLTMVPWHLYMFWRFGSVFVNRYFLLNLLGRTGNSSPNQAPSYWYFVYFIQFWQGLLLLGVVLFVKIVKMFLAKSLAYWYLLSWILVILIPFSLMSSKVWWYVFPATIPTCLLLAKATVDLKLKTVWQRVMVGTLLILVLVTSLGFSYRESLKRTDHNRALVQLSVRHRDLKNVHVLSLPYEAALFYFNTGNFGRGVNGAANLLVTTTEAKHLPEFKQLDQEGDLVLLQRIN